MDFSYLLFLQRVREACGSVFDPMFLLASEFGKPLLTFLLFALVYWCVDKRTGIAMGWNIGLGCVLNTTLKNTFHVDRPWIRDGRIHPVESALPDSGGYSMPSGHTSRAVATWGVAGTYAVKGKDNRLERKMLGMICWLIVMAVMFSRNILGVHTPQDVLVALIIGGAVITSVHYVILWADSKDGKYDLYIAIGGMILCFLPMLRFGCMGNCGAGMGIFAGWFIERRFINFNTDGTLGRKALRFAVGAIPALFILNVIHPLLSLFMAGKYAGFFMQGILAIYITVLYPFLFNKAQKASEKSLKKIAVGAFAGFLVLAILTAFVAYMRTASEASTKQETAINSETSEVIAATEVHHMDVIGHRGYPTVAPENTIPSFEAAMNLGVDWIETDVQLTKDGVPVLFHDNDINRITGNEGAISDYTYDELKQMDFGSWFSEGYAGTAIPTLQEFFDLVCDSDVNIYLELKDIGEVEGFTKNIYEMVEANGLHDRVVYASFNYGYLQEFKAMDSTAQILLNTSSGSSAILNETPSDYYGVYAESVTPELIQAIHEAGDKIFVWTPDSPQQIQNLYRIGADGVCTNQAGMAMVASHSEYSFLPDNAIWTHAMPGLYETNLPENHTDMVWQGFTKTSRNLISAAYSKSGTYNSIFYVMDLNGNLQNVVDAGFKAHMGGIAYDVNHDILWSTGPEGMVYALPMASVIDGSHTCERLVEFDVNLYNTSGGHVASFLSIDGNNLYVGSYCNGSNGALNRYDISDPYNPSLISQVTIPDRIQSVAIRGLSDGTRQILMTQGYETDDGHLLVFTYDDETLEYIEPELSYLLPEGPEQILWTPKGLYIQFESAALPYRATARVVGDQLWLIQLPEKN